MQKIINIEMIQRIETQMLDELSQICQRNNIKYSLAYGSVLGAVRHNGPIPWDSDVDVFIQLQDINRLIDCLEQELSDKFKVDYYTCSTNYELPFPRIGLKNTCSAVVHVDLFILVGLPNNRMLRKLHIYKMQILNKTFRYRHKRIEQIKTRYKRLIAPIILPILNVVSRGKHISQIGKHWGKYPFEESRYVINCLGGKHIFPKSWFDDLILVDYEDLKLPIPRNYDSYLKELYGDYMTPPPSEERAKGLARVATISETDYINFWPKGSTR